MNAKSRKTESSSVLSPQCQIPMGFQTFCAELSLAGQVSLERISLAIDARAPRPGILVYVRAKKLAMWSNGLEPVVFSAIDASTHLQVAQAYLAMTTAAAVSFVEFVAQSFPFPISQIRTPDGTPFHKAIPGESDRDFSTILGERGYFHSLITDPTSDALFVLTSRLVFGGITEGSLARFSSEELQRELIHALFFHNNYRSVPWLGGKTPVQRLKTFEGFAGIHWFSPFEERGVQSGARASEPLKDKTGQQYLV